MNDNEPDQAPSGGPALEVIAHESGGYFVGVRDEIGVWPFQSEVFGTRKEAETELAELNVPLPYEALCPDCAAGYSEQEFRELGAVSGLWSCPCSQNSLLFPSMQTVEESVRKIHAFMAQRGA